jgi:hypothetical protein
VLGVDGFDSAPTLQTLAVAMNFGAINGLNP